MKFASPLLLRLSLGLLLLFGLCLALGVTVRPAHAQSNLTVTDCSSDSQLQADVSQANTDNAGDIITFTCSGDIKLTSTLNITGSMTLDGSDQSVTLDGNNQIQVLIVNSGVTFNLKTLTVANGLNPANTGLSGGLYNDFGTVTVSNSTFANNSAPNGGYGGGIFNSGSIIITNSTFTNNSAPYGGALVDTGTVTISNSTFATNTAAYNGGGIWSNSSVSISSSTFAHNTATSGYGGGIYNGGTLNINGSIVANNTAFTGNDCYNFSTINDNGYNLEGATTCGFTGTGSLQNTDPKLNSLASNGGLTQTMSLQQNSPAIDQIPLAQCPTTDQRGDPRPDAASPAETTCDIGAYESNYTGSLIVNSTNVSATEGAVFNGVVAIGSYSGNGTLSASIAWGDGTTNSNGMVNLNNGSFSVTGSHTYAEEGNYTIMVSVNDGQGLSGSANSPATVSDATLTLKQFSTREISHLTEKVTAHFTDADPAGTLSDYTATISWGDGSNSSATIAKGISSFSATGTHHYTKKGSYTVTLTITDQGGSQIIKTVIVTVR